MSEWWTYRLSDFLLFSAPTYRRLFALHNAELWPAPLVGLLAGAAVLLPSMRRGPVSAGAACLVVAAGWLWVAWAFHLQRYATINWAAPWFAAAFAAEAALLAALGVALVGTTAVEGERPAAAGSAARPTTVGRIGAGLLVVAVFVYPALAAALGGSWRAAEVINLAPDPTALGTLGLLLLLPSTRQPAGQPERSARWLARAAWPLPLLWCAVSGATLWTLQAPEALLLPGAALLAVATARLARRPASANRRSGTGRRRRHPRCRPR